MMDGGIDQDWPEGWVPVSARRVNAIFHINGFLNGVPQVTTTQTDSRKASGEPDFEVTI